MLLNSSSSLTMFYYNIPAVFSSSSPTLDSESPPSEAKRLEPASRQLSSDIALKTTPHRRGVKWLFDGHSRAKHHLLVDERADQGTTDDDDMAFTIEHRHKMSGDGTITMSNGSIGKSRRGTDTSRPSDEQTPKLSDRRIKSSGAEQPQRAAPSTNETVMRYDDVSARRMKLKQFSSSMGNVHSTAQIGHQRPPTGNRTKTMIGKSEVENTGRTTSDVTQQPINQQPATSATSVSSPVVSESRDLSWLAIERVSRI